MYKQIPVTELEHIADILNQNEGWDFVAFILSPNGHQAGWLLLRKS